MSGSGVVVGMVLFVFVKHVSAEAEEHLPRVVTPFPAPKITELPQFQGVHKETLYWGTYRPQLYLGIRARTPKSLIAGLMWIVVKDGRYHLRHVCRHEDDLSSYGWTKHNGRDFGNQVLVDHGLTLNTGFLKSKEEGSGYGGDWAVQINVQADKSKWNEEFGRGAQLFFYLADEGGNALNLSRKNLNIRGDSLLASGSRADIGDWQLHLKSMDDLELHYSGFHTPHFHNLSDRVEENLASQIRKQDRLLLSDSSDDSPNVLVFQIIGGFSFTTDFTFISGTDSEGSKVEERVSSLTGTSLSNQLKYKEQAFDEKFEKIFNLAEKVDPESISVGKAAVGNLIGGIGYFYGQSKIALSGILNLREHVNYISYWPAELYTAVPCRPSFPRGFLWDEGFHQLIIWRWDIHISLDIIGHWLDLMNADGWIPREQILGAEALSRVPEEYVPQHPTNGNPPTLFLALNGIVNGLKNNEFTAKDKTEISLFLERAFVRLEAWFQWFNTTQSGKQMSSYYWHGRDNKTILELNPKARQINLTKKNHWHTSNRRLLLQQALHKHKVANPVVQDFLSLFASLAIGPEILSMEPEFSFAVMLFFELFTSKYHIIQPSVFMLISYDKAFLVLNEDTTLTSGFDDYPRASHPSADERHVDLRCWMLLAADCLHSIEELLDKETKPEGNYGSTAKLLSDVELLNQMHYDDRYGAYFDFGNHTEKIQLKWKEVEIGHNNTARQLVRDVLERPVLRMVPHIGYVSLFPFMGKIISPVMNQFFFNLFHSSLYMKFNSEREGPYWRGQIWINMNYRILSALHHYSKENGPYQDMAKAIYKELRSNLIRNIVRNYEETGFLWEQYDQNNGKGKGSHPFTGWTSLMVLIMAEAYDII
uniref:Mannosyl-oligosaccharide glucosidase n=1 Tax=Cajanus cajan TaxID=3821 RepID=A0A151SDP1_CAJCA|nr:Mannosyl-oligosaccharide glucosidase [Cajanus cajan]